MGRPRYTVHYSILVLVVSIVVVLTAVLALAIYYYYKRDLHSDLKTRSIGTQVILLTYES